MDHAPWVCTSAAAVLRVSHTCASLLSASRCEMNCNELKCVKCVKSIGRSEMCETVGALRATA
eukprot:6740855-Prymnesium_polylepis.1